MGLESIFTLGTIRLRWQDPWLSSWPVQLLDIQIRFEFDFECDFDF